MLTPVVTQVQPLSPHSDHIIDPECGSGAMLEDAHEWAVEGKMYDLLHLGVTQYA